MGVVYDYRFGSVVIQAKRDAEHSPVFQVRLADLLRKVPKHELRALVKEAKGPQIPGGDIEPARRAAIEKTELKGKTVLDIGGYDGWAAKLALDCGANRAICIDNHQFDHYGWKQVNKQGVEYDRHDYFADYHEDAEAWCEPVPDIIIFYNVLYHLKNPWAALDKLRATIKPDGEMLLCTLFRYHDGPWVYLYEPRECNKDDETVYFGPSISALERLLTATGWTFQQEGIAMDRVVYRCRPVPGWQRKHEDS